MNLKRIKCWWNGCTVNRYNDIKKCTNCDTLKYLDDDNYNPKFVHSGFVEDHPKIAFTICVLLLFLALLLFLSAIYMILDIPNCIVFANINNLEYRWNYFTGCLVKFDEFYISPSLVEQLLLKK